MYVRCAHIHAHAIYLKYISKVFSFFKAWLSPLHTHPTHFFLPSPSASSLSPLPPSHTRYTLLPPLTDSLLTDTLLTDTLPTDGDLPHRKSPLLATCTVLPTGSIISTVSTPPAVSSPPAPSSPPAVSSTGVLPTCGVLPTRSVLPAGSVLHRRPPHLRHQRPPHPRHQRPPPAASHRQCPPPVSHQQRPHQHRQPRVQVLSCIRLIIRKVLKEKLSEEGMQKLLPPDLSNDFRKILVALLLKYQILWEEEAARDQPLSQQTRLTFPGRVNAPPAFAHLQVSDISSWPRENTKSFHGVHSECPAPGYADSNLLHTSVVPAFRNNGTSHDPATLPRLKCMSWTMESRNSVPGNRLSIITLKLQDFTKSHLGEVEFKFHLSRDTLEAMLRSMAHINNQLSDSERLQLEPTT